MKTHPLLHCAGWLRLVAALLLWSGVAHAAPIVDNSYVLRPNDEIRLEVFDEPDLCKQQVKILKTGQASFPLIGSVDVAGISVAAAAEKIRQLYAKDYLKDPKVTLSVLSYAPEFVSVIGAVNTQGQIPIPAAGIDLGTAMATVGGTTPSADPNGIQLVRASGATATYSMNDVTNGPARAIRLAAGDRIIVKTSQFVGKVVNIGGCVQKQGALQFPVNGQLDLVTAIAAMGGLTDRANPKKIKITHDGKVREVDFNALTQKGLAPVKLFPGDIVFVPESIL